MKKYELTEDFIIVGNAKLFRIKALRSFFNVNKGDIGGFVSNEINLSHHNNAWVYGNARVYGSARVYGNAEVSGNAQVYGSAWVYGGAWVSGNAWVYGNAEVYGDARVYERYFVKFGKLKDNSIYSIVEAQTGLKFINDALYCFKHVRSDLSSLHDNSFQYVVGEYVEVKNPDLSNNSCASGLHVSNAQYWNRNGGEKILFCKVHKDDIITVQEGKVRCKKLFVIGVCDGETH